MIKIKINQTIKTNIKKNSQKKINKIRPNIKIK